MPGAATREAFSTTGRTRNAHPNLSKGPVIPGITRRLALHIVELFTFRGQECPRHIFCDLAGGLLGGDSGWCFGFGGGAGFHLQTGGFQVGE
jgi:hypothetical protein